MLQCAPCVPIYCIQHRYSLSENCWHYLLSDRNFILGMTCMAVRLCFCSEFSAIWTFFVCFTCSSFLAHKRKKILQQSGEEKKAKNNKTVGKSNICSGFYGALNISDSENDKFQLCSFVSHSSKTALVGLEDRRRARAHTHTHTHTWQCTVQTQIHVHFLIFHIFKNQQTNNFKYYKTDHKTHFLSGANPYMFRQYGAIVVEFFSNESS
jgi:hypothetical protein